MSMQRLVATIFFSIFLSIILCSCDKVEEINTTIQDVKQIKEDAKEYKEEVKRLKETVQEQKSVIEESEGFIQKIQWIVWIAGIGGLILLFYSPFRNLVQRTLFKVFPYKPRRFDKDKE